MADATHDHLFKLCLGLGWILQGYLLFHGNSRVRLLVGVVRLMVGCSLLLFWFFFLLIALVLFLFFCSSYCGLCLLSCFFLVFFVGVIVVGLWILEGCEKS